MPSPCLAHLTFQGTRYSKKSQKKKKVRHSTLNLDLDSPPPDTYIHSSGVYSTTSTRIMIRASQFNNKGSPFLPLRRREIGVPGD